MTIHSGCLLISIITEKVYTTLRVVDLMGIKHLMMYLIIQKYNLKEEIKINILTK
jgi:hypothetical protein